MRSSVRKAIGGTAAGFLAVGLMTAPPALANYAPGLPPAAPGVPNNPPAPAPIVPSVVLVSQEVAQSAPPRALENPPAPQMGDAPRPNAPVGQPVALIVPNAPAGSTWVVEIKRKGGAYNTLGSTVANSNGQAVLPVFRTTRPGVVIMALRNVQTGEVRYVKVNVRRR